MKPILFLTVLLILTASCASNPTYDISAFYTADAATKAVKTTEILQPTITQAPTNTPKPKNTPIPTETETPIPSTIHYMGTGDQVLDVEKGTWPGMIRCVHHGSLNFVVTSYNANGDPIDLIVNTMGSYDGYHLLDLMVGQNYTKRLEVKASGEWTIIVYPLAVKYLHILTIPGTYNGTGDDVVALSGTTDLATFDYHDNGGNVTGLEGSTDLATFDYQEVFNFIVMGYATDDIVVMVNEIGPYHGQVIVPFGTVLLEVDTRGPWSVEITSK